MLGEPSVSSVYIYIYNEIEREIMWQNEVLNTPLGTGDVVLI